MTPTLFGAVTVAVGLFMLFRSTTTNLLVMTCLFTLMGGSAALILPSLGGSTVQPAFFALGFMALKCILPAPGQALKLQSAASDLLFLSVFVIYGAVGAWILPRIFDGVIDVTPLRPIPNGYIYADFPLAFSSQNVTVSVYLVATLLAAFTAHMACQRDRAEVAIARTAAIVSATHALLGLSGVLFAGTAWTSVLKFFRNGFYAQLDQSFDGYVRMSGIWPEPAVYSAYGFSWLVFTTELWLRDVERRWTGPSALILALALLLSTSTTAYIGLVAYGLIITLRIGLMPGSVSARKALIVITGGLIFVAAALAMISLSPELADAFGRFVAKFTVDKAESASALQRTFWAKQGIEAFWASGGLGIGPGSFRSSSLATAIFGSMGIIGITAILFHLARVFKPLHKSTYNQPDSPRVATGAAASWAAIVLLIPPMFSAASPDPGLVWGIFCGIALGLRPPSQVKIRAASTQ